MDYFNEDFLSMNDRSTTISGVFASGMEQKVDGIMRSLSKEANSTHEAECPHNEDCRGTLPYMIAALKRYMLYNEMNDMERLALVAVVMYSLGVRGGEERGMDRMVDKLADGIPKPPSFEEFLRMMRGMDDEEANKK